MGDESRDFKRAGREIPDSGGPWDSWAAWAAPGTWEPGPWGDLALLATSTTSTTRPPLLPSCLLKREFDFTPLRPTAGASPHFIVGLRSPPFLPAPRIGSGVAVRPLRERAASLLRPPHAAHPSRRQARWVTTRWPTFRWRTLAARCVRRSVHPRRIARPCLLGFSRAAIISPPPPSTRAGARPRRGGDARPDAVPH